MSGTLKATFKTVWGGQFHLILSPVFRKFAIVKNTELWQRLPSPSPLGQTKIPAKPKSSFATATHAKSPSEPTHTHLHPSEILRRRRNRHQKPHHHPRSPRSPGSKSPDRPNRQPNHRKRQQETNLRLHTRLGARHHRPSSLPRELPASRK